jgi:hypothetical protein
MTARTVFVGPTLPAGQVAAILPDARILPPVRHGDLLRLDARAGDTVLIIDGLFLQTASVRHREITYLLGRGVTVAGSSSMGALRAAELWRFGMRGYGEVFRLYRDGEIDGDDEVAIVHGTAEDGYRACSDPLVSIRVALRDAAGAGVLSAAEAELMLARAIALPFRSRSFRALETRAPAGLAGPAGRFREWRSARDTDLKAADARLLLAGPADEALATLLVRAFGASRRWSPSSWDLPPSLRTDRAVAAGRAVVLAARRHDRGAPGAGDADRALAAVWGCEPADLEPRAWDRGIPDLATLRRVAAPFAGYLLAEEAITDMSAVMSVV